jgi:SPP1 gp7 family putative phage head morphogenesis protein
LNCSCPAIHTHAAAIRYDPTKTTSLRRKFEGEAALRFRKLKGKINRLLIIDDAFGLTTNKRQFAFPRSSEKVSAFMEWLDTQQKAGILEVSAGVGSRSAASTSWSAVYVRSAYQRGMSQGAATLRRAGVEVSPEWVTDAFTRPFHADRVALAYTRVYDELRGITAQMDTQISRSLGEGLSQGLGPRQIAQSINNRVDKIGITRARMMARTEVIRAHAEASLNTYEEAGILGVGVEAEWRTAQDASVCPECEAASQSGPYTIAQARGMIPLHPNCRCAWLPIVENPSNGRLT